MVRILCATTVALSLWACGSTDDPDNKTEEAAGAAGAAGADNSDNVLLLPDGTYLYTLVVPSLSDITLPFQLDMRADQDRRLFTQIDLRAVGTDGELSEIIASLNDIVVGEGKEFVFRFPAVTVPGAYVPTGSDIQVDIISQATIEADQTFCGTVSGSVISLGLSIDDSLFGTAKWNGDIEGPSSCDPGVLVNLEPIDASACPELVVGRNAEFSSGARERSFELALPEQSQGAPLVFVFHGLGGNGAQMMQAGAQNFSQSLGAVVVAADGLLKGSAISWDSFKPAAQNEDIIFFDDLLTCIAQQYEVDESRIYATGMSFGGLMTGTLMVERAAYFAAVAPMSGGTLSGDLSAGDEEQLCLPSLVLWGGEDDVAFEQDFDLLSRNLLDELQSVQAPAIACNHGGGHVISPQAFAQASTFFSFYDGSNLCSLPPSSLLTELGSSCVVPD